MCEQEQKAVKWGHTGILIGVAIIFVIGFFMGRSSSGNNNILLNEGIIWTVEWTDGEGKSHYWTRNPNPIGGNGSWNIDMLGRLYPTHLEIVNRKTKNVTPKIIPMHRIVEITFGDGGIHEIQ